MLRIALSASALGAILLWAALVAGPQALAGGTPALSATSAQINVGADGTAGVVLSNAPAGGAGAWQFDVSYDNSVVSVTGCSAFAGACNRNFGPQTVRVIGGSVGGVADGQSLVSITFHCNALGSSALSISGALVSDISVGNPTEFTPTVSGGSVTCVQAPPTNTPRPQPTNTPRPRPTNTPRPAAPTNTPRPGVPTNTPPPAQLTNTPVAHAGQSSPTPRTPTPKTTPTEEVTPTSTRTSEVLAAETPGSGGGTNGDSGNPVRRPSASEDLASSVRPETTSAVVRFGDVSTDPAVIATNIVLAIILLTILMIASGLFNDTIDLNREELSQRLEWLLTPMYAIGSAINWVAGAVRIPERLQRILAPIGIVLLCGVIYSFNEPPKFNETGLLLFLSLIISIAVLTYIFEGGMAIMSRERYHVPSGVKVFPLAILIAIGFVALSRAVNFEAPIMFGFVAVATALAASRLRDTEEALTAAIPTTILLVMALIAWGVLGLLRDAASDSSSWYASLPSESAAMIFAGGVEGVLFAMVPVQFSDGYPIWKSLRWWWAALAGVSAFVFTWALLNPAAKSFDALIEGRVLTAIGLVSAYALAVVVIWAYFALKARSRGRGKLATG